LESQGISGKSRGISLGVIENVGHLTGDVKSKDIALLEWKRKAAEEKTQLLAKKRAAKQSKVLDSKKPKIVQEAEAQKLDMEIAQLPLLLSCHMTVERNTALISLTTELSVA